MVYTGITGRTGLGYMWSSLLSHVRNLIGNSIDINNRMGEDIVVWRSGKKAILYPILNIGLPY